MPASDQPPAQIGRSPDQSPEDLASADSDFSGPAIGDQDKGSQVKSVSASSNASPFALGARYENFSRLAFALGLALVTVYATNILSGLMPVRILDPGWQIKTVALFVNNVGFPLVALAIFALAADQAPQNKGIARAWHLIKTWSPLLCLLYLVIVPVHLNAVWQARSAALREQQVGIGKIELDYARFKDLVLSIDSATNLRAALAQNRMGALSDADMALPLPTLRRNLLAAGQAAHDQAINGIPSINKQAIGQIPDILRISLTSLVVSEAFGAVAQPRQGLFSFLSRRSKNLGRLPFLVVFGRWLTDLRRSWRNRNVKASKDRRARELSAQRKKMKAESERKRANSRKPRR
jgi:hypothetical protein